MKIEQRAGRFSMVAWTDGYPEWVKLIREDGDDDEVILDNIHPDELPDLYYIVGRMIEKIAAETERKKRAYA